MTARSLRRPAALLLGVLLVAACGGTGSGPAATADPTAAPGATATPPPTSGTAAPTSAGGSGGNICDLVTGAELSPLFGGVALTPTSHAAAPDSCIVEDAGGRPYVTWSIVSEGATMLFDAVNLPGQATPVSGMGDRAAFVENLGLLIQKGDRVLTIVISGGADLDPAAIQEVSQQIGAIAASRM